MVPPYDIGSKYSPIFTLLSHNVPFCRDSHKIFCHLHARFRSILILLFRSCPRDTLTLIKYFACKNGWEMGIAVVLQFLEIPDLLAFLQSHKIFCLVILTNEDESHIALNWLFCVYAPFS